MMLGLPHGRSIDLSGPAVVMAIINCTADSFHAPSRASGLEAVERCLAAEKAGAGILDIGGESTRPGAAYVREEEELSRVIPVVEALRRRTSIPVSIDTRKYAVAKAALDAGADIINDISALEDSPDIGPLCAEAGAAVVLMHKKGIPTTMQQSPLYGDVVTEVREYLLEAAVRALACGISADRIVLDPGIGFGKQLADNLALLAGLAEIGRAGYPVLVGLSRKTFIGAVTGRDSADRLAGSIAAAAFSLGKGARILRVHDVAETVDLVRMWDSMETAGRN